MQKELITVVIPLQDSLMFIIESLTSVLNQTVDNIEVILLFNSSLDPDIDLVHKSFKDSRIKLIRYNRSRNKAGARNLGIKHASGRYIAFLDPGGYWDRNSLERRYDLIESEKLDFVFCRTNIVAPNRMSLSWVLEGNKEIQTKDLLRNCIHINSVLIKKSALKSVNFNESFNYLSAWELITRIALNGSAWKRVNGTRSYTRLFNPIIGKSRAEEFLEKIRIQNKIINSLENESSELKPIDTISNHVSACNVLEELIFAGLALPNYPLNHLNIPQSIDSINDFIKNDESTLKNIINENCKRVCLCNADQYLKFLKENKIKLLDFLSSKTSIILGKIINQQIDDIISELSANNNLLNPNHTSIDAPSNQCLLLYPLIYDKEILNVEISRLSWYLHPVIERINKIHILTTIESKPELPFGFDKKIKALTDQVLLKVEFVKSVIPEINFDYVLSWKKNSRINNGISKINFKKLIGIDAHNDRYSSSNYLKLGNMMSGLDQEFLREQSRIKFQELYKNLMGLSGPHAYIFGTGPNLSQFMNHDDDFENCLTIACNSMVKNKQLLQKIKPNLFVAADPIFHAGCSSYASKFREELVESMNTFPESKLIVPERDYLIFVRNCQEIDENRIIGIPFQESITDNFNLSQRFHVKIYPNVLTLFLIPLSVTFSKEIYLAGFDGKKESENQYFWSHNKQSQFSDELTVIKNIHPSFFQIDYSDYYYRHCKDLEKQINSALNIGVKFINLTDSHIKAISQFST